MWSVLIIDDERNFCAILEDYIVREGGSFFVRACFTDGQLAWDWLEETDVDLIITDTGTDPEIIRKIREKGVDVEVV